ncbi:MAG: PucR family transcriptional regulator [Acidimicrobiales bacterium]
MTETWATGVDEAMAAIVERARHEMADLGPRFARTYQSEILDYRTLDDDVLYGDVVGVSMENLANLLDNVQRGELIPGPDLERYRQSAARRVHQGVSLEALLHAYRLWCRIVWQTIIECSQPDRPEEREAALRLAGRVLEHMNLVSTVVAQAYVEEAQGIWHDREVVRRDLLDALLAGRAEVAEVRAQAEALRLDLAPSYLVAVIRKTDGGPTGVPDGPLVARAELRRAVERVKARLQPSRHSLVIGVRHDEIVVLYPSDDPRALDPLRDQAAFLAPDLDSSGFCIGLGGWHPGPSGAADSYAEAKEAAGFAARRIIRGQPVAYDDIVLGHVLQSNPRSRRLLADALGTLHNYDRHHHTELVATLDAYLRAGFNVTRSAKNLCVHPNTVVYRLKRVRELTGRDPNDPNDLLLLCVGLKVAELDADPALHT